MNINSASVPAPFAHENTVPKWKAILSNFTTPGDWVLIEASKKARWSQAINNYAKPGEFSVRKATNGGYVVVFNGHKVEE